MENQNVAKKPTTQEEEVKKYASELVSVDPFLIAFARGIAEGRISKEKFLASIYQPYRPKKQ